MIALHRTGRTVEALGEYAGWRRLLAESWEIEPGHAIQQVWADISARTA